MMTPCLLITRAIAVFVLGTQTAWAQLAAAPGSQGGGGSGPLTSSEVAPISMDIEGIRVSVMRVLPFTDEGDVSGLRVVANVSNVGETDKRLVWVWHYQSELIDNMGNEYSAVRLNGALGACLPDRNRRQLTARGCWAQVRDDFFSMPSGGRATVVFDFLPKEDRAFPDLMALAEYADLVARLAIVGDDEEAVTSAHVLLNGLPIPK